MTDIKYTLWNPNGNITALVETDVNRELYAEISERIMEKEPSCEQVGFLGNRSLTMAGNEFCGNASMSAAAYFYKNDIDNTENPRKFKFTVSGCDDGVEAVVGENDNEYAVTLTMPHYRSIFFDNFVFEKTALTLPVVDFDGIMHIIIENGTIDKKAIEEHIKKWCDTLNAKSLGVMLLDSQANRITPLVYVKEVDTLFWESSCASGTAAVGAYLSNRENRELEICFFEPAGKLTVVATPNKAPILKGTVKAEKSDTISL